MPLIPILVGASAFLAVLGFAGAYHLLPARALCPRCGGATSPVLMGPASRLLERWVEHRWCAACEWEGLGRKGPVRVPGQGPVSHDSGFRWGEDRLSDDFGFRWKAPPPEDAPRAHPSGFRWGGTGAATTPDGEPTTRDEGEQGPPAHPAGFRWAGSDDDGTDPGADEDPPPSHGFRWGSPGPAST